MKPLQKFHTKFNKYFISQASPLTGINQYCLIDLNKSKVICVGLAAIPQYKSTEICLGFFLLGNAHKLAL